MARKSVSSGDTLTIACKLPQGLHIKIPEQGIDIRLETDASDKAVERKDVRVGFEPIDPKDPSNGLPQHMRIQADGGEDFGPGH